MCRVLGLIHNFFFDWPIDQYIKGLWKSKMYNLKRKCTQNSQPGKNVVRQIFAVKGGEDEQVKKIRTRRIWQDNKWLGVTRTWPGRVSMLLEDNRGMWRCRVAQGRPRALSTSRHSGAHIHPVLSCSQGGNHIFGFNFSISGNSSRVSPVTFLYCPLGDFLPKSSQTKQSKNKTCITAFELLRHPWLYHNQCLIYY